MRVSLALAVYDGGGFRHREGDVIAVCPSGWQWGEMELRQYLIAELDLGAAVTRLDVAGLLQVQLYAQDRVADDGLLARTGKRRFQVPFAEVEKLVSLDSAKLLDETVIYQPLAGLTLPLAMVFDRFRTRTLNAQRFALLASARTSG